MLRNEKTGQVSLEGIIAGVVGIIIILIMGVSVFFPIYNQFSDNLAAVPSGYGNTAGTILLVAVFVILPLAGIIIAIRSPFQRQRPPDQPF